MTRARSSLAVEELGFKLRGTVWGRPLIEVREPAPLLGTVFIGIIDRGTNVLQVRPTTLCPISCIFCSVDAGPYSRRRAAEFIVEPEWLALWVEEVAKAKNVRVEALIDGVGEPLTYPWIVKLVKLLKSSSWVETVAVETHGAPLSRELVDALARAGLDRINLSIETLDEKKARMLTGMQWFSVSRVIELAEYIVTSTPIDLHVTPVWLPGVNDEDVIEVVRWALRIGAGKRWPPVTVQKYIAHKHGRKPAGVREPSWSEFWSWLRRLERKLGTRLSWTMEEWGMRYARRVKTPYRRGERVKLRVVSPGWLHGELLAVTSRNDRLVTLVSARGFEPGDQLTATIISDKDGILIARP
jgi:uncharacterized Fe-S cluster-containing radical SAM superfamily enzyme